MLCDCLPALLRIAQVGMDKDLNETETPNNHQLPMAIPLPKQCLVTYSGPFLLPPQ